MVSQVNCLTGAYDRKLKAAQNTEAELAEVKKRLAAEKTRSGHLEEIAVNHGKTASELAEKLAALKTKNDQVAANLIEANVLVDGLSAKKVALIERLKSEVLRLGNSRE